MSEMEWYGDDVIRSVNQAKEVALTAACTLVEGSAKTLCPVDTGNLRSSLTHEVKKDEGKVGTNVEYSPHVEFGTVKMKAQPYLRPGLDTNRANINKILGDMLGKAAEAGGRK